MLPCSNRRCSVLPCADGVFMRQVNLPKGCEWLPSIDETLLVLSSTPTSLLIITLLLPRYRRPRTPRHKRPNPQYNPQHPTNHHKLEKRTTPTPIVQIIQRPLHPPPRPMPRAIQLLMPHLMPMLIEMRHVVVHALRETTRSRSRGPTLMVVRSIWTIRRVL